MAEHIPKFALWAKAAGVRLSLESAPTKALDSRTVNELHRLGVRSFGVVLNGQEIGRLSHDGRQWSFARGRAAIRAMAPGGRLYSKGAFVPEAVLRMSRDQIPGGLADKSKSEPSKEELEAGIAVEMEHTNDRKLAEEIAGDHLVED